MIADEVASLGIVGHAQEKFTPATEAAARQIIAEEIARLRPRRIVSGNSPMGGVDWYARDAARSTGLEMVEHTPRVHQWGAPGGYKDRNLLIARDSDMVLVVVVSALPPGFRGMRFGEGCYHCGSRNPKHIKSGGCWTAWKAKERLWRII